MKHYMRECAEINLDAVAYNFKSMKDNLTPGTKMVAVVKTDGYGHGAVPIAQMVQEYDYIWGFATATIEEALLLRQAGVKKPILILGFVFPDAYEEVVKYDIVRQYSNCPWPVSFRKRLFARVRLSMYILK